MNFFEFLNGVESFLWSYIGFFLIIGAGILLSIQSGFAQFRGLFKSIQNFLSTLGKNKQSYETREASSAAIFFASLGGCVGIGSIVSIAVAVQIGGPGSLVWVWIVSFLGMMIKYAEVYLGLKFRVENESGSYDGGPMFFLRYAFPKFPMIANIVAVLMCFYGAEVYLFSVIKESFVENFAVPSSLVVGILLILVLASVLGGIKRVGTINAFLVPFFIGIFLCLVGYILFLNYQNIPSVLAIIFKSAFTGQSAIGGFAGSSLILTMSKGISSACYCGDLGVGYASIIHSETKTKDEEQQASLAIVAIFIDTFIVCTAVILLVLFTDVWQNQDLKGSLIVQAALSQYFPYMNFFMSIFILMLGFSTITAYMCAGIKSAKFLSPKNGKKVFLVVSSIAFVLFSFLETSIALDVMCLCGGLLMLINIPGIIVLRKYVKYRF